MESIYHEFLAGFGSVTELGRMEADAQWSTWSYQLSDEDRQTIEAGGREAGENEGKLYAENMKEAERMTYG